MKCLIFFIDLLPQYSYPFFSGQEGNVIVFAATGNSALRPSENGMRALAAACALTHPALVGRRVIKKVVFVLRVNDCCIKFIAMISSFATIICLSC